MNATEIRSRIAVLPALPVVVAADMLRAQGYTPTAAERNAIAARSEFFKAVGMPSAVRVEVADHSGAVIGHLEYRA